MVVVVGRLPLERTVFTISGFLGYGGVSIMARRTETPISCPTRAPELLLFLRRLRLLVSNGNEH